MSHSAKNSANINNPTATPIQKPTNPFPAWRLPNGIINASNEELERSIGSCERWGWFGGALVVVGVVAEVAIAAFHPPYNSFFERWGSSVAGSLVALGVALEIKFGRIAGLSQGELRRRSDEKAANANERAAKADLARIELEGKLRPRELNQAQWDFIQTFAGKFEQINIGYETDAETWWYASDFQKAFFAAGIKVGMYPRAPNVHTFRMLVYEPRGLDGARPRTIEPLVEIFRRGDVPAARISLAVITGLPGDIQAPPDIPMVIIGGRFLVLPAWHPSRSATNNTLEKNE